MTERVPITILTDPKDRFHAGTLLVALMAGVRLLDGPKWFAIAGCLVGLWLTTNGYWAMREQRPR